MSEHRARIAWARSDGPFTYDALDRNHTLTYGSGVTVAASSAPDFKGDPTRVDPEEMFCGALASCHLLTFLALAARKRMVVDAYEDDATAVLAKDDEGRMAVTQVILRPKVTFAGDAPSADALAKLHDKAHRHCFIAASVRCGVKIEPRT